MSPSVALLLWLITIVVLLRWDPAKTARTSYTLWVPLTWMFIVGSRLPSQWLGSSTGQIAESAQEGDSLDRSVYSALILLAASILISRSFKWKVFFSRNLTLMAMLGFSLVSVLWSDFPLITIKRWIRDIGVYLVIIVALSDPRPIDAVSTLLRRLCYLLTTLSAILIKYYPHLSKVYDFWDGTAYTVGVATSKNMLGVLCLISGLFFFWDTTARWHMRRERRTRNIILLNAAFFVLTLWLLNLASSATSRVCLAFGCIVIAAAQSRAVRRRPELLTRGIPAFICLYLLLRFGLGFDISAEFAKAVGRDPTFTGRTNIWSTVLSLQPNAILGAGYESFWLGPRLASVWREAGQINEAHNGYLEVYLNLGLIGVLLLLGFLFASYRKICSALVSRSGMGVFAFALWTILLFYNVTESAFGGQLMWVTFLLGAMVVPVQPVARVKLAGSRPPFGNTGEGRNTNDHYHTASVIARHGVDG